jgi:hypothetical protein
LDEQDDGASRDMIQPCHCAGSSQYVHRACLDNWRATKPNARSFTHCDVCQFEFEIESADPEQEAQLAKSRLRRFRLLVARDTLLVFLAFQLMIIGLGALIHLVDTRNDNKLRDLFPDWLSEHGKTTYYICGFVLFFLILGIIGMFHRCCCHEDHAGRPRGGGGCGGCWYCGSGSGGGGNGCSGEGVVILLVICAILIVIIFLIGVIVGIVAISALMQRIFQRHMHVLWLRQETKRFRVVDLSSSSLRSASTPAISSLRSALTPTMAVATIHPSAPLPPVTDATPLVTSCQAKSTHPLELFT